MKMRGSLLIACAGLLAACATQPIELAGTCSLDDPASEWVVGNKLARQAEQYCHGDYRVLEHTEIKLAFGHEYRWLVDCP